MEFPEADDIRDTDPQESGEGLPEPEENVPSSDDTPSDEDIEQPENYHALSKEGMVEAMEKLCEEPDFALLRDRIPPLKEAFSDLIASEMEASLERYLDEGGEKEDFHWKKDDLEKRFSRALRKATKRRHAFIEEQEKSRQENLAVKKDILDQLKELIQNEENMSRAFHTFHDLQARWRATGPVPQQDVRDLLLTYKHFTDQFYSYIRLNHELQELDHKKNLEMRIGLCEQVEALLLEPSINQALQKLLVIQNTWRELGSVGREHRTEIGERYKAACDKLFDRKKDHARDVKEKQEENAALKERLCEKVESLAVDDQASHHDVMEMMKALRAVQEEWRSVGFAGKKPNEALWVRFRAACQGILRRKNEFFAQRKKEWQTHLQAKTELCIQAEALAGTTDWRKGGQELRRLHAEWKKTGFAGSRMSDKIWSRFKQATDRFYENRRKHFESVDKEYAANYESKLRLIDEIMQCQPGGDKKENMEVIRAFQRQWSDIGMVPIDKKEALYSRYKEAVDALFEKMNIGRSERSAMQYKQKIEHLKTAPDAGNRLHAEKKTLMHKLSHLQSEVTTWENNLGFFAKSKNAESIIRDFESKIDHAKAEIEKLRRQLDLIKSA